MPTPRTEAELEELSETPMTADEWAVARKVPGVRGRRHALGLTLEQFSDTDRIPPGTLRDREQGRCEPGTSRAGACESHRA